MTSWSSEVITAHHLVELQDVVVLRINERIRTPNVTHLHAMRHMTVEVELDRISSLEHAIRVKLILRCALVAEHHALMLLALLRVIGLWRVRVAHQVIRVITLGLKHIDLAVAGPVAQLLLATNGPERRPGRACARKLDARLDVEAAGRGCIQHSAIGLLRADHARRERRIIGGIAVLTSTRDLRTVPLSLRGRVPGSQVQVAISHGDVIWAVSVGGLRSLSCIKATVLITPLGGIERVAVELIAKRHLVAIGHNIRQGCGTSSTNCRHRRSHSRRSDNTCSHTHTRTHTHKQGHRGHLADPLFQDRTSSLFSLLCSSVLVCALLVASSGLFHQTARHRHRSPIDRLAETTCARGPW